MRNAFTFFLLFSSFSCFTQPRIPVRPRVIRDSMVLIASSEFTISGGCGPDFGQYSLREEDVFVELKLKEKFVRFSPKNKVEKEYDDKGREIRVSTFDSIWQSQTHYTHIYDEAGNMIRSKWYYKSNDLESFDITDFTYYQFRDSVYRPHSSLKYHDDPGRYIAERYFYNNKFQLIELRETSTYSWGDKINYQYDEHGKKTAEIRYRIKQRERYNDSSRMQYFIDSADEYYKETMVYDCDGDLIEKTLGCMPYLVKSYCQHIVYNYDLQKRLSKVWFYTQDSLFSRREYEYNDDNTLRKLSWFHAREAKPYTIVNYYYTNNELTKVEFTADGKTKLFEFSYIYDSHHNWIEQTKKVNGSVVYVRGRSITYWD